MHNSDCEARSATIIISRVGCLLSHSEDTAQSAAACDGDAFQWTERCIWPGLSHQWPHVHTQVQPLPQPMSSSHIST